MKEKLKRLRYWFRLHYSVINSYKSPIYGGWELIICVPICMVWVCHSYWNPTSHRIWDHISFHFNPNFKAKEGDFLFKKTIDYSWDLISIQEAYAKSLHP